MSNGTEVASDNVLILFRLPCDTADSCAPELLELNFMLASQTDRTESWRS